MNNNIFQQVVYEIIYKENKVKKTIIILLMFIVIVRIEALSQIKEKPNPVEIEAIRIEGFKEKGVNLKYQLKFSISGSYKYYVYYIINDDTDSIQINPKPYGWTKKSPSNNYFELQYIDIKKNNINDKIKLTLIVKVDYENFIIESKDTTFNVLIPMEILNKNNIKYELYKENNNKCEKKKMLTRGQNYKLRLIFKNDSTFDTKIVSRDLCGDYYDLNIDSIINENRESLENTWRIPKKIKIVGKIISSNSNYKDRKLEIFKKNKSLGLIIPNKYDEYEINKNNEFYLNDKIYIRYFNKNIDSIIFSKEMKNWEDSIYHEITITDSLLPIVNNGNTNINDYTYGFNIGITPTITSPILGIEIEKDFNINNTPFAITTNLNYINISDLNKTLYAPTDESTKYKGRSSDYINFSAALTIFERKSAFYLGVNLRYQEINYEPRRPLTDLLLTNETKTDLLWGLQIGAKYFYDEFLSFNLSISLGKSAVRGYNTLETSYPFKISPWFAIRINPVTLIESLSKK
jgi:hypothetical protein